MESKSERFRRVAPRRTNAVLKKLQVLGHCANRSAYEYTDQEVAKIFAEIERATRLTRMKFQPENKNREFKL